MLSLLRMEWRVSIQLASLSGPRPHLSVRLAVGVDDSQTATAGPAHLPFPRKSKMLTATARAAKMMSEKTTKMTTTRRTRTPAAQVLLVDKILYDEVRLVE